MSPLRSIFRFHVQGQPICPVCREPVSLESSKADERGQAIHEECYVEKIRPKKAPKPTQIRAMRQ